jgi:hypothetical protein
MTKNRKKITIIKDLKKFWIKNYNLSIHRLPKGPPSFRRSIQLSKENSSASYHEIS